MRANEVLIDAFERIRGDVHGALAGLAPADLAHRVDPGANPIGWLVWHLTRVQDDHVADLAGTEQAWTADGWADRFGLDLPAASIGYGHTPEQVSAVADAGLTADDLIGYHDAVTDRTVRYLRSVDDAALDDVIDGSWDPPVTRGVRLVSVVNDDTQHAGQAAYVAGVVGRLRTGEPAGP